MGRLNFHGCLISKFFSTDEICVNFMHTKIAWFTVIWLCDFVDSLKAVCEIFSAEMFVYNRIDTVYAERFTYTF